MIKNAKLFTIGMLGLFLATPALAELSEAQPGTELTLLASHIDTGARIENIQERREAVLEENFAPFTLRLGAARFTLSGLIEAEAALTHREGGDEADALRLNTVQIGLDAEFTPWLSGHIIGLWEVDVTEPMVVDEAALTLTTPWQLLGQTPALHLGRQYLPFGRFESAMISDPLTLELGETHTTAAVLALTGDRWSLAFGGFEGSTDNDDEGIDSWVATAEVTPREGLTLGASWISDLAESDASLIQEEELYRDKVAGWSAFVALQQGDFGMTAEYLAAVDRFKTEQVAAGGDLTGRRPEAWNLELSWQATEQLQLATRYEETEDYQANIRRYGATASYGLCDYALLAVEYLHADADNTPPEHTFTAQLVVEF